MVVIRVWGRLANRGCVSCDDDDDGGCISGMGVNGGRGAVCLMRNEYSKGRMDERLLYKEGGMRP